MHPPAQPIQAPPSPSAPVTHLGPTQVSPSGGSGHPSAPTPQCQLVGGRVLGLEPPLAGQGPGLPLELATMLLTCVLAPAPLCPQAWDPLPRRPLPAAP